MLHKFLRFIVPFVIILALFFSTTLTLGQASGGITVPNGEDMFTLQAEMPGLVQAGFISPLQSEGTASIDVALGEPGLSYRYVKEFGTPGVPYIVDTIHINRPNGLYIDIDDNIFITEERGHRVLVYDDTPEIVHTLGVAGECEGDDRGFCNLRDVAVDPDGNFWAVDSHRVVQYDPTGAYLQQFPADHPWESGSDNDHFDDPSGLAFDSAGRLYVSDHWNQRIQVFDLTTGSPVYSETIGHTGEISDTPGYFNEPMRIAIDSSDALYVTERGNQRVQKCEYVSGWSCSVLDSDLGDPQGIAVETTGNVFIADSWGRIHKCTSAGACSDFAVNVAYFDVAVDSAGNVYGADPWGTRVEKYDSAGVFQEVYLGVSMTPYLTDADHFYNPRVAIDADDNIIIIEDRGQRLIKLDPEGNFLWDYGVPGIDFWGDGGFVDPHSVATDLDGNIYVAEGCQVEIIDPEGNYLDSLGSDCGNGDYEFNWATGVDVDQNGSIYVADYPNHRVMIYDSSLTFVDMIGATGECDSANDRLCFPIAVETDAAGNIYVTDAGNLRVQKYNSSLDWQMTIGNGTWGESFDQFAYPEDIAVDALGRIFVTDWNNHRVQVFDSAGTYLTTIGGAWGTNNSQLKGAPGVDVDSQGNVYVADWENFLIKVFAPGYPGWVQSNINGFGNRNIKAIPSMGVFNNHLYASATEWEDDKNYIYRTADGKTWEAGNTSFFSGVSALQGFGNYIYAGTWGNKIYRSDNGLDWTQVFEAAWGISHFSVYNGALYAGVYSDSSVEGTTIYKTTDGLVWEPFVTNGNSTQTVSGVISSATFNGLHYFGAADWSDTTGAHIWRTDGITVSEVVVDGFGDPLNRAPGGMTVFSDYLYVSLGLDNGYEVWRSPSGDKDSWENVLVGDPSEPGYTHYTGLATLGNKLYLTVQNDESGIQVWTTTNGVDWFKSVPDGFGDSNNTYTEWGNSVTIFNNQLYVGVVNTANGGEIWRMLHLISLPLVIR